MLRKIFDVITTLSGLGFVISASCLDSDGVAYTVAAATSLGCLLWLSFYFIYLGVGNTYEE